LIASPTAVCDGGDATISIVGGVLGTGASWYLFDADPTLAGPPPYAGAALQSSATPSFNVTGITASTTYYILAEGACNTTTAVSTGITVNASASLPSFMLGSPNSACTSTTVTFNTTPDFDLGTDGQFVMYNGTPGDPGVFPIAVPSFPFVYPITITNTTGSQIPG